MLQRLGTSPTLRPDAGRRLAKELRARRVGALARHFPDGVKDPGFAELLAQIDGGPPSSSQRLLPFFDGDEAMTAMLRAIDTARKEVLVEAYIFTDDSTGRRFADALTAAASRGVRTALLADAWGSFRTHGSFWQELKRGGVEVHLFHPLLPAFRWFQFRDHRKLLVVDRRIAFTGGMNIADEYSFARRRLRRKGLSMRDTHLRVEGSVAQDLARVFAEGWYRAGGGDLPADLCAATRLAGELRPESSPEPPETPLVVLDTRPGRGSQEIAATFAAVLGAARRSIWISVGYFAPDRGALANLEQAAAAGCDVRLLLPGPTDVPIVRHAGHATFARLLRRGVRIWEYGPAVLHAKSLVVDGFLSIVGSANLDVRSWRFNAECGLLTFDRNLAAELSEAFLKDLEVATEITRESWRRRGLLHRLGDRLAGLLTPLL